MSKRKRCADAICREEAPWAAIFATEAAHEKFLDAMYDFRDDHDRPRYARRLLALGVHREAIDWHLENPGQGRAFIDE